MKKTSVTWRLSFLSIPSNAQLERIKAVLKPITRIEAPSDGAAVIRELGLSDFLFIEPEQKLSAGEIAFNCLSKARLLGKGRSVMCPGFPRASEKGWRREDVERAAMPECLHGLCGGFNIDARYGQTSIPGMHSAGFTVTVLE